MAKAATKKRGRPPTGPEFAEDVIEELLDMLAEGKPLAKICSDKRMPSTSTVYRWIESDETFAGRFRARKAIGVHALADQCLEIADEAGKDPAEKRVRIDTRLRLAGKWLPQTYGDKVDLTSAGEKIELDPVERATRLAAIFAEIEKRRAGDAD